MRRALLLALIAAAAYADGDRAAALAAAKRSLTAAEARAAARTLAALGDAEAVDAVLDLAVRHEAVRDDCAPLLQQVRDPAAVQALGRAPAGLRAWVIPILGAIPTEEATDALLKLARKDGDRAALVDALKRRDHRDAAAFVARAASEEAKDDLTVTVLILRRYGLGHAAPAAALGKLLASHRWEDRVYALDAIGPIPDARVGGLVAECLGHRVWQVRMAAAEALAGIRVKEVVEPLIARLEAEDHPRVREALGDALHRITGENLRDYAGLWRKWWDRAGPAFEVPRQPPGKAAKNTGETKTVATFYGVPVVSKRVVFVIDLSTSMRRGAGDGRSRFEVAVDEVLASVRKLGSGARINVIFFGNEVWRWKKRLTRVAPDRLERDLRELQPSGGTFLWDGLAAALDHEDVETIFLLSDGEPTGGEFVAHDDILRAARKRNQLRRATIHCVAVGMESGLLKRLAAANGGDYVQR